MALLVGKQDVEQRLDHKAERHDFIITEPRTIGQFVERIDRAGQTAEGQRPWRFSVPLDKMEGQQSNSEN